MTPAEIAEFLRVTSDVGAARTVIAALTGDQVRVVAGLLGITVRGKVAQMRAQLLFWAVERRMDSATIAGIH